MSKAMTALALLIPLILFAFLAEARLSPGHAQETGIAPMGALKEIIPGYYRYNSHGFISGVIDTSDGVVVIDALGSEVVAKDELRQITAMLHKPVRYLISSTFHNNYTRGNVVYTDAVKIGTENYRTDLVDLMQGLPEAQRQARLPDLTYGDRMALHLGGKDIEILYIGRAHTRGDSIVFVPKDHIVYMSELFFYDRFPWMDSGYVNWINAIDIALKLDANIFVPAHGTMPDNPLESRQALVRFRKVLVDARDAVEKQIAQGATQDQAAARVLLPQYKELDGYRQQREVVVRRMYEDLKGELP
jgi:glyoxylase-like metal-dependent hydrolase (beta-lactamase superfamily II)